MDISFPFYTLCHSKTSLPWELFALQSNLRERQVFRHWCTWHLNLRLWIQRSTVNIYKNSMTWLFLKSCRKSSPVNCDFPQSNGLFKDFQSGFRAHQNAKNLLLQVTNNLLLALDCGLLSAPMLLDLSVTGLQVWLGISIVLNAPRAHLTYFKS